MKRIVVTGIGSINPLSCDKKDFWQKLLNNECAIKKVTKVNPSIYGEKNKATEVHLEEENIKFSRDIINDFSDYGKAVTYAAGAVDMCLKDAGLKIPFEDNNTHGIIIGTTNGNQDILERVVNNCNIINENQKITGNDAKILAYFRPVKLSASIAKYFNIGGMNMVIPTACAAGNYAIGTAYSMIQEDRASIVITGGADAFTRSCYTVFYRLGAMSPDYCKPFDQNRNGMIVGEGSAMLVLEELEHALNRKARIYGEIKGYGLACDAYHPTTPDPEGSGAVLAMNNALSSGKIDKNEISYISSHGTGTKANDAHEAKAMYKVFGEDMQSMYVNSVKSMLGHCMGAASALEAIIANLSLYNQKTPRNRDIEEIDTTFPVKFQVQPSKDIEDNVENILSNSFAFGGNICSIIFGKYENNAK